MFDEADLVEFIDLAAYLEEQAEGGLFPQDRFEKYSNALDHLVHFLAHIDEPEKTE